jgi:peptide/nickel transport system substrate-binding protein
MSLRTRRWPVLMAALMFVAAACGGGTTPTGTPAAPTGTTTTPTGTAPGTTAPGGSPTATPAGTPEVTPTATAGGSTTPGEGGALVFAEWQPVSQLNPFFSTAFSTFESLAPALRGMLTINEAGAWTADLATDVPSADNQGLIVNPDAPADCITADAPTGDCFMLVIHLKPGLKWSDGTDLTMNDLKATYDWAAQVGEVGAGCSGCASTVPLLDSSIEDLHAKFAASNRYIKDIAVSDDGMTATVTWQKNYAGWLGWASFAPLQAAWLATVTPENAPSSMPVGPGIEKVPWSGPFMITAASTDGIEYVKNPNWNASNPAHLDTLTEKFYASKDGMITDFLSGGIDLAFDMTQADFPAIQAVAPDVGKATLDSAWQYEHFDLMTAGGSRLGGKPAKHGLDDVEVRTAIAMAVDKEDLVNVLFPGMGVQPACSVAPPGTPWRAEGITCAAYDPAGAKAKLDAAGWVVDDATGLRTKDGNTIHLQLCTTAGNPTRLTELSKLNQYLSAIGIPSDVSTADATSVVFAGWANTTDNTNCSIYRGTYDIADYAYVLGGDLYSNYYFTYHSKQIPSDKSPDGSNDTRLAVPDMDAALDGLGVEVDPAKQNAFAATVQQTIATQNNEIPIYYRAETTGVGVHVGGWGVYNPSSAGPTWHVEDWFFIP